MKSSPVFSISNRNPNVKTHEKAARYCEYRTALEKAKMNNTQFIQARDIAQYAQMLRNPECDTPWRRRQLAHLIRQWNAQQGRVVKVTVVPHRCNQ